MGRWAIAVVQFSRNSLYGLLAAAWVFNQAVAGCMDTDTELWKTESSEQELTYQQLMELMACPVDSDAVSGSLSDQTACNYFIAMALNKLFKVNDFLPEGDKWPTANEIAEYVETHDDKWEKLGRAEDQSVLNEAAAGAANGQPVIAVRQGADHGHVAIILPGELRYSSNWKMDVPNSASFLLGNVDKAYVFCRLSFAFHEPDDVEIYWRLKE
jgi:hypothetical protein